MKSICAQIEKQIHITHLIKKKAKDPNKDKASEDKNKDLFHQDKIMEKIRTFYRGL